nr:uL15 family ribosomal protein [Thermoleophilaceae bacterium]
DAGTEVTPEVLKEAGLIGSVRKDVKILGSGDLSTKLTVSAHAFSKSAREKIEAAGGTITWLRGEPVPMKAKPKKRGPGSSNAPVADPDEVEDETPVAAEEPDAPEATAADAEAAEGEG